MKKGESQTSVFVTGYGTIVKLCELKALTKNKLLGLNVQEEKRPYPGEWGHKPQESNTW